MDQEKINELLSILVAIIILSISYTFKDNISFINIFIVFTIILSTNILSKKAFANYLNIQLKVKFWSIYQTSLLEKGHLKKPLTMAWLPLLLSYISKGIILWIPILITKEEKTIQRITKDKGMHRFSEVTEWEKAQIICVSIFSLILICLISSFFNFILLSKLSIYFALWSLIPLSNLDGSKLFFGSKKLWTFTTILTIIFFLITLTF